ncbi:testis-specific serine/threonine-protein kinase 3 [Copidosoma floridanum]|uniref:testis-specific serine/threonine-protein kinase 3 n=1 Tax=Copidosoma floridanum TaxID=29053 RepID=UPI0006C9C7FE|nr:testis-specific serine/threonine-protein kinase 3 [Copidosoma floridanum]
MAAQLKSQSSAVHALEQRGYLIGKKIGQGTHATVHLAEFMDGNSGKKVKLACKIFNKKKAPHDFLHTFFPRELQILTKIEHPHIIQVHSILQRGPQVFIFMQYAENGDLLEFIRNPRVGTVPEQQARIWFRQMASALQYLHRLHIAHRDLKCENILLSRRFNAKLADFGFARYCVNQEGRRVLSQTYCGSAAYAAPEVVAGSPYNPKMADVWSLGVILFIMLNGVMPFNDKHLAKLLKDQQSRNWAFQPKVRESVSGLAVAMVKLLLEPDVTLRLTVDRVMGHDWLRSRACKERSASRCLQQQHRQVESPPMVHHQHSKNTTEHKAEVLSNNPFKFGLKNQIPLSLPLKLGLRSFQVGADCHNQGNKCNAAEN